MMRAAVQSRVPTRKEEVKLCRDRRPITTAVSSNAHVLQGWVAVIPSLPLTFLFSNILNISQHGAALVLARPKQQSLHWRVKSFQSRRRPNAFNFGIWESYTLGDARKQRRYHR
jgi:hypothetical protein